MSRAKRAKIENYFGYALDNFELHIKVGEPYGFTKRQALAEIMANHLDKPNWHTVEGNTRIRALEDPDKLKDIKVID